MDERSRFNKGLFAWVGFRSIGVPFQVEERESGVSRWRPRQLLRFAIDGVVSFSTIPLRVWSYLGLAVSAFAFVFALFILIETLLRGTTAPGFPTLIISVMFFAGVQLISLGVIGEYLGRVYEEVKGRPLFVVSREIGARRRSPARASHWQRSGDAMNSAPLRSNKSATDPARDLPPLRHWGGFLVSGLIALTCDAAVLQIGILVFGLHPLAARLIAISVAMVAGWLAHRRLTFSLTTPPTLGEFTRYSAIAWTTASLNYAAFAAVLYLCARRPSADGPGDRVNCRHIFRIHRNALRRLPGKPLVGPSAAIGKTQKKNGPSHKRKVRRRDDGI